MVEEVGGDRRTISRRAAELTVVGCWDNEAFKGKLVTFAGKCEANLAYNIQGERTICLVDRLGTGRHAAAKVLN